MMDIKKAAFCKTAFKDQAMMELPAPAIVSVVMIFKSPLIVTLMIISIFPHIPIAVIPVTLVPITIFIITVIALIINITSITGW